MEKSALKCSSCDDLIGYTDKIKALGEVITELAFQKSEWLEWSGGELGRIISDYAQATKNTLEDLYQTTEKFFQNGDVSFIAELKKDQKDIQDGPMDLHGNIYLAREAIKRIDNFLNDDLTQIIHLKGDFEKTAESITKQLMGGSEEKETSAKHDGQAEAQSAGFGNQAKKAA